MILLSFVPALALSGNNNPGTAEAVAAAIDRCDARFKN